MESHSSKEVRAVYKQLIDAWNNRNARGMADLFTEDGETLDLMEANQTTGKKYFRKLIQSLNTIKPLNLLAK